MFEKYGLDIFFLKNLKRWIQFFIQQKLTKNDLIFKIEKDTKAKKY